MDILMDNQLEYVLDKVKEAEYMGNSSNHLEIFVQTVRMCGVSFEVWPKRNADGSSSGLYASTPLMGDEKKKVLAKLPDLFHRFMSEDDAVVVKGLWVKFQQMYEIITSQCPTNQQIVNYATIAPDFINTFISLADRFPGYEKKRVTPYMHIGVQHIPGWLLKYHSIKQFTGQGVEKKLCHTKNSFSKIQQTGLLL